MTWCNDSEDSSAVDEKVNLAADEKIPTMKCPSCGHVIQLHDQAGIHDLPGLPAGVKFDPTDHEILEHLEAKVMFDTIKLHPLIDQFIPTLEGENGICYTHPEKLPGVSKDGLIRHFFHRPSKAYTTGTRKRRKVHTDEEGGETRWHKTGKTRPVFLTGSTKGFKKILVLYTNYGRQRKPEKTNWVMHQYHLGNNEEEKDGELVVSKVFYQTQPRQCGGSSNSSTPVKDSLQEEMIDQRSSKTRSSNHHHHKNASGADHHQYNNYKLYSSSSSYINFEDHGGNSTTNNSVNTAIVGTQAVLTPANQQPRLRDDRSLV